MQSLWSLSVILPKEPRKWREALKELEESNELRGSKELYSSLLLSCSKARALAEGKRLHSHISRTRIESFLAENIAEMYIQCGGIEEARRIMDQQSIQESSLWSALISAYVQQHRCSSGVKLFQELLERGTLTDAESLFIQVLAQFRIREMLVYGKMIHSCAASHGLDSSDDSRLALLKLYVRCGSLEESKRVFDGAGNNRNPSFWALIMTAYLQEGSSEQALVLLKHSLLEGVKPNEVTLITALRACSSPPSPIEGRSVHKLVSESGLQELIPVSMSLIKMYGKCGCLIEARRVLDAMKQRDVAAWTVMIASYSHHGELHEAFQLLKLMDSEGVSPNEITFLSILRACKRVEDVNIGKMIHACVLELGFESDVGVGTSLVNMYGKWGDSIRAHQAFLRMKSHEVSTWNCLLAAFSQNGRSFEALELYRRMQLEGHKPDEFTLNIIIDACSGMKNLQEGSRIHELLVGSGFRMDYKLETALITLYRRCGDVKAAVEMFERLSFRDHITWNTMMEMFSELGSPNQAMLWFHRMLQEGLRAARTTLLTVLNNCRSSSEAEKLHSYVVESGFQLDLGVSNALVSAFGKHGGVQRASEIFEAIPAKDSVSWTALIGAYAENRRTSEVWETLERMQDEGVEPTSITYILLLNSCSNLAQGKLLHSSIPHPVFEADEFLQTALVNMYARCGSLDEARIIFEKLKRRDSVLWSTMIAAHAQHGFNHECLMLFDRMKLEGGDPDNLTFVSVLSACSHAGLLEAGVQHFVSITRDFWIDLTLEHLSCVIDLLARAGQLREAEFLISTSRFTSSRVLWMTLLGACRVRGDAEIGKLAAARILELEPNNTAARIVFSNLNIFESIYLGENGRSDAAHVSAS